MMKTTLQFHQWAYNCRPSYNKAWKQSVFPTIVQKMCFSVLRRKRKYLSKVVAQGKQPTFGPLEEPYAHGEKNMEEYLKKANLSPWVPIPDSAARKIFDLCHATREDIHVDLGSGDGRVNFHAIDFGISKSVGIDIDEHIVEVARKRLQKRHPLPDLEFIVADLTDGEHPAWGLVQQASIVTMYFATEGLNVFRPLLESKMVGKKCKIVTCGYEMPGWESSIQEVVLGMQINLYNWGSEEEDDGSVFLGDDILLTKPKEVEQNILESSKFQGSNVIDRSREFSFPGFNPDDDEDDWLTDDDDDEEEKDDIKRKAPESEPKGQVEITKSSSCKKETKVNTE